MTATAATTPQSKPADSARSLIFPFVLSSVNVVGILGVLFGLWGPHPLSLLSGAVIVTLGVFSFLTGLFCTYCITDEHDSAPWRPAERFLPRTTPAGWEGPFMWDHPRGSWLYWTGRRTGPDGRIGAIESVRLRSLELSDGRPVLSVMITAPEDLGPPTEARCRAILDPIRGADWQEYQTQAGGLVRSWACRPEAPWSPRPIELQDATRVPRPSPDEDDCCPDLAGGSFDIPDPIAFPREPFADALARHEALVRARLDALLARELDGQSRNEVLDSIHDDVGEISVLGSARPHVWVGGRNPLARHFPNLSGIRRRILTQADRLRLDVVVHTDDLISIRETELRVVRHADGTWKLALVLESPEVIHEPTHQELTRSTPLAVVRWQARAGADVHETTTRLLPPKRTDDEAIDRFFAVREARVRRALWESRRDPTLRGGFVWLQDSWLLGIRVSVVGPSGPFMFMALHEYPRIQQAISARRRDPRWYPVLVDRWHYAGLRWLAMCVDAPERDRPPSVDERRYLRGYVHAVSD